MRPSDSDSPDVTEPPANCQTVAGLIVATAAAALALPALVFVIVGLAEGVGIGGTA